MKKIMQNLIMKKKILSACLLLLCAVFGAAACAQQMSAQTLTDLMIEVENLPQLTADGAIYISIHDPGMEWNFEVEGWPTDLLQDTTIKYQIKHDNEASLYEIHLQGDFPCYTETLECTLFADADYLYINVQDFCKLAELFIEPDELAELHEELAEVGLVLEDVAADGGWLAQPLEKEDVTDYAPYYGTFDDQFYLDELQKFSDTIGKAYAGFSSKVLTVKNNSFNLELDNAGLAELINNLIDYTWDNMTEIAQACIDYVNVSNIFVSERESIVETMQEVIDGAFEVTDEQREYVRNEVVEALTNECPMDFGFKYSFAKTKSDTYVLEERFSLLFDEEYFGEPSDVLISVKNTTKAVENLQITIPTKNIVYFDELAEDYYGTIKADM